MNDVTLWLAKIICSVRAQNQIASSCNDLHSASTLHWCKLCFIRRLNIRIMMILWFPRTKQRHNDKKAAGEAGRARCIPLFRWKLDRNSIAEPPQPQRQ
eukprot:2920385-Rhodomonas_salina.2